MSVLAVLVCALIQVQSASSGQQARGLDSPRTTLSRSEILQLQSKSEAGDAAAQVALGTAYQDGNGVPQDSGMAVKWYRRAAEQGNAEAQNDLGVMYRTAAGVEKNEQEAVQWYRKAAHQGYAVAMFNLGTAYYNGDGVASSLFMAYDWFLMAQANGYPQATDAVRRTGAEIGAKASEDALIDVGKMYETGTDLAQNYAEAAKWYRRSAERKNPEGMVRLADMLIVQGGQQNYSEALHLCLSASKESVIGEYCVGYLYQSGLGVEQNLEEARKRFGQCAESGLSRGMMALARMEDKGQGGQVDRADAYYWYVLAYVSGVQEARAAAVDVWTTMSAKEIKRADDKLRRRQLDPKKVFQSLQSGSGVEHRTPQVPSPN